MNNKTERNSLYSWFHIVIVGQPAYEMMESDPDWAPSLRMGHTDIKPTDSTRSARRFKRDELRNSLPHEAERLMQQSYPAIISRRRLSYLLKLLFSKNPL